MDLHELILDEDNSKQVNGCDFFPFAVGECLWKNLDHETIQQHREAVLLSLAFGTAEGDSHDLHHCITNDWKELKFGQKIVWNKV